MTAPASNSTRTEPIAPGIGLHASALQFTFSRSGGPGGQNVNKVNTRAELTVDRDALAQVLTPDAMQRLEQLAGARMTDSHLRLVSSASRSQLTNRRACMTKLRELIVRALVKPRRRIKTKPSKTSIERRLEGKRLRSHTKQQRQRPRQHDD